MDSYQQHIEETVVEAGGEITSESLGILEALRNPGEIVSTCVLRVGSAPSVSESPRVGMNEGLLFGAPQDINDAGVVRLSRSIEEFSDFPGLDHLVCSPVLLEQLRESQLTTLVQYLEYDQIIRSGPTTIRTSRGVEHLSVYDQIRIRYLSVYYSRRYSSSPVSPAFEFMRYLLRALRGPPGETTSDVRRTYLFVTQHNISDLVRIVGNLLLGDPETVPVDNPLTGHIDTEFQDSQIAEFQAVYPEGSVLVFITNELMSNRERSLQPFSPVVGYNDSMSLYFEAICDGTSDSLAEFNVSVRPVEAITTRVRTAVPVTPPMGPSPQSSAPAVQPPPLPILTFGTLNAPPVRPTSLLSQATQLHAPAPRDTSFFVSRVQSRVEVDEGLDDVQNRVSGLESSMGAVRDDIASLRSDMTTALAEMNVNIANLIALFSSNQMHSQAAYSRTILGTGGNVPDTVQPVATTPTLTREPSVRDSLIQRLTAYGASTDPRRLLFDLQAYLSGTTLAGAASSMTLASLAQPGYRTRLLSRLRNL